MLFESQYKNHTFGLPKGGEVKFRKGAGDAADFGTLDTAHNETVSGAVMSTADLDGFIMGLDEFKSRIPGKRGIWKRDERLTAAEKEIATREQSKLLESMPENVLRAMAVEFGVKEIPLTAKKAELIELVKRATAGQAPAPAKPQEPAAKAAAPAAPEKAPTGDESDSAFKKKR